ncbi:MAG: DUF1294 domain-containing protein [Lachnospiraceae bacterium]|nr:DUF1294 domain-containing protein [Lachnospiraceae bacterium]
MGAVKIILIYLAVINIAAFFAFGMDKVRAKRGAWRISESSLITFALFGGSIGALIGMFVFRHKTLKPKFYIGIPLILLIQLLLAAVIFFLHPFKLSFM